MHIHVFVAHILCIQGPLYSNIHSRIVEKEGGKTLESEYTQQSGELQFNIDIDMP